jgi:HK97 family phage major capsid protein
MAPIYDQTISRANLPIPDAQVSEIVKAIPEKSVVLNRARRARLSTKVTKQNVLTTLPEAYWVNGDTGLKQTTTAKWENVTITAEELAVLVPIPNALIDDTSVPLWSEVRPLLAEAIAVKADNAILYGYDKPASWPVAVLPGAVAAGNVVAPSSDLMVDVGQMGGAIAGDGFTMDGFVAPAGYDWALRTARDGDGRPIYDGDGKSIYGTALDQSRIFPLNVAALLGVDWSSVTVGVRQDMTFDLFDQMVINDADGKVVFNAAQQDSKVMRVVFRLGYAVAIPVIRGAGGVQRPAAGRFPAAVLDQPAIGWQANTAYALGSRVTVTGGTLYANNAGLSGAAAPENPAAVNGTVVDNDITWKRTA